MSIYYILRSMYVPHLMILPRLETECISRTVCPALQRRGCNLVNTDTNKNEFT